MYELFSGRNPWTNAIIMNSFVYLGIINDMKNNNKSFFDLNLSIDGGELDRVVEFCCQVQADLRPTIQELLAMVIEYESSLN